MASIYLGNLPYTITQSDITAMFAPFGTVKSVKIIADLNTERMTGYGVVDIDTDAVASAVAAYHDREIDGRRVIVVQATPRLPYPRTGREAFEKVPLPPGNRGPVRFHNG